MTRIQEPASEANVSPALTEYAPLPNEFKIDGFDFHQLNRASDVVLFEKSKPSYTKPSFEVIMVQKQPPKVFPNGHAYPARESMPRSELWGTAGWTYPDLKSARKRFNQLVAPAAKGRFSPTPFPAGASFGLERPIVPVLSSNRLVGKGVGHSAPRDCSGHRNTCDRII